MEEAGRGPYLLILTKFCMRLLAFDFLLPFSSIPDDLNCKFERSTSYYS